MKNFYSCVDSLIPTLSEQHLIIKNKAKKEGGLITITTEYITVKPAMDNKLKKHGLVVLFFFST